MFSYTRQRKKLIKVRWVCITLEIICSFFINFQSSITIFYLNWFQFQIIIITIYEHPLVTWIYISKCKMYQNVTVEILSLLMKRKNKRTFNNISKKVIGAINKVFKKKMNWLTMVPLPQQERSVDTYFSIAVNGETVNDKRRYEWLRLRSFLTFPLTS